MPARTFRRREPRGIAPFKFDPNICTFTPGMAKRTPPAGPFNAAPICQGNRDSSGTPDLIAATMGSQIAGKFYGSFDPYQGTYVFWVTPEWNGNDGLSHFFVSEYQNSIRVFKSLDNKLYCNTPGGGSLSVDVSSWVAGTTYCVVVRWDYKNTLDGTNYGAISINDTHTFGATTSSVPTSNPGLYIGFNYITTTPANAIIQGLTIYRRPLYDGAYGVNAGNGDEINLIYAAGAGKDPTLITGSWDVVFCLPTNGTAGALVTGTGEAWSHPHSSNVLKHGLDMSYYGGGAWAIKANPSVNINCGHEAGLNNVHAAAFTWEGWFVVSGAVESFMDKSVYNTSGIAFQTPNGTTLYGTLFGSSGGSGASHLTTINWPAGFNFGCWHHLAMTFDFGGDKKVRLFIDGKLAVTGAALPAGFTIGSDAATNLLLGNASGIRNIGWCRVSNSIRYAADFVPSRTPPASDANTLAQWNMSEGTGTTVDNIEGTAGRDGTITNGVWEEQWVDEGTPVYPKSINLDGSSTVLNCGSDAKLDNLHAGPMTAEGWFFIAPSSSFGNYRYLIGKSRDDSTGWLIQCYNANAINVTIPLGTTSISYNIAGQDFLNRWHHIAFTFDPTGDYKVRIYLDRVLIGTSIAGAGTANSDAAHNLTVGSSDITPAIHYLPQGSKVGWVRISNVVRDIAAETYTREKAPASDANTMLLLPMTEGVGNPVDTSASPATCTLTNGTWNNSPDLAVDSPGARIYPWGQVVGGDAAAEGVKQTLNAVELIANGNFGSDTVWTKGDAKWTIAAGVAHHATGSAASLYQTPLVALVTGERYLVTFTIANRSAGSITPFLGGSGAGTARNADGTYSEIIKADTNGGSVILLIPSSDFVGDIDDVSVKAIVYPGAEYRIRALGYSEDGIGKPRLVVYNETGSAAVVTLDGTTTSTEWTPNILECCFQVPAGCTSLSIKLVNATATGVVGWHKAMMLTNLWIDGGFEVGTAVTNIGTPTTSEQSTDQAHSPTHSWKLVSNGSGQGISRTISTTAGKFYVVAAWVYQTEAGNVVQLSTDGSYFQDGKVTSVYAADAVGWKKVMMVFRAAGANTVIRFKVFVATTFYVDDVMVRQLDDVSLTVTPASAANSVEGTGIRADGIDLLTQPVTKLKSTHGRIKFKWTPRHNAAGIIGFGSTEPHLFRWGTAGSNRIIVYASSINAIRMSITSNGTTNTGSWDCTGAIVAGTTYTIEIKYSGSKATLSVNGVVVITISMTIGFTVLDPTAYFAENAHYSYGVDAVISAP